MSSVKDRQHGLQFHRCLHSFTHPSQMPTSPSAVNVSDLGTATLSLSATSLMISLVSIALVFRRTLDLEECRRSRCHFRAGSLNWPLVRVSFSSYICLYVLRILSPPLLVADLKLRASFRFPGTSPRTAGA